MKSREFVCSQELPDPAVALQRAQASLDAFSRDMHRVSSGLSSPAEEGLEGELLEYHDEGLGENTSTSLVRECCHGCRHLQEWLPRSLSLDLCRATTTTVTTRPSSRPADRKATPNVAWSSSAPTVEAIAHPNQNQAGQATHSPPPTPTMMTTTTILTDDWYLKDPLSALHLQSQMDYPPPPLLRLWKASPPLPTGGKNISAMETDPRATAVASGSVAEHMATTLAEPGVRHLPAGSSSTKGTSTTGSSSSSSSKEPILYGEEQERLMALQTEGFPETWHPWITHTIPSGAPSWADDDDDDEEEEEDNEENDEQQGDRDGGGDNDNKNRPEVGNSEGKEGGEQKTPAADNDVSIADDVFDRQNTFTQPTLSDHSDTKDDSNRIQESERKPTSGSLMGLFKSAALELETADDVDKIPPSQQALLGESATMTTPSEPASSSLPDDADTSKQTNQPVTEPPPPAAPASISSTTPEPRQKQAFLAPLADPDRIALAPPPMLPPSILMNRGASTGASSSSSSLPPGPNHPAITSANTGTPGVPASNVMSPNTAETAAESVKSPTADIAPAGTSPSWPNENPPVTVASSVALSSSLPPAPSHACIGEKPPTVPSASSEPIAPSTSTSSAQKRKYSLSDGRYWTLHSQADQIRVVRRAFLSKRTVSLSKKKAGQGTGSASTAGPQAAAASATSASSSSGNKKKKLDNKPSVSLHNLVAWRQSHPTPEPLTEEEELAWAVRYQQARTCVELWMGRYRWSRQLYWKEQSQRRNRQRGQLMLDPSEVLFGSLESTGPEQESTGRCCKDCQSLAHQPWLKLGGSTTRTNCKGDELMQCLECTFIGCAPVSIVHDSNQHMVLHMVTTNHKFAVTCGADARVYCFDCNEFVSHQIFQQEKERLDLAEHMPIMAWKEHPLQRSFDAFQFFRVQDHGIVWKGMVANYPPLVPQNHLEAARRCRYRQILFHGDVDDLPVGAPRHAVEWAIRQSRREVFDRWKIELPVGMYNLGNTCFQNAILQCLIHCRPLQRFFLDDVGHHYLACPFYRSNSENNKSDKKASLKSEPDNALVVCLACEMDRLYLNYLGRSVGFDVVKAVAELPAPITESVVRSIESPEKKTTFHRGEPLLTAEMLTAAWKCGGMDHLAGYEQRDAHEFLHSFLEILDKHTARYYDCILATLNRAREGNSILGLDSVSSRRDMMKTLFEGTLRSVLVCQECWAKRIQPETFMSISLPLSKEVQRATSDMPGDCNGTAGKMKLSVERCLRHFTMPETLADPVFCPACEKKTPTKKQHVVSKLPRVLCLHLKRFDAAQNRKIEDFVCFPSSDLNMAPYLPHWCEVTKAADSGDATSDGFTPRILYDLFATVNHFGNLQSGHYVTNVKVGDKWFHCNDAHVSSAGAGDGELEVLNSDGAYVLFYMRK